MRSNCSDVSPLKTPLGRVANRFPYRTLCWFICWCWRTRNGKVKDTKLSWSASQTSKRVYKINMTSCLRSKLLLKSILFKQNICVSISRYGHMHMFRSVLQLKSQSWFWLEIQNSHLVLWMGRESISVTGPSGNWTCDLVHKIVELFLNIVKMFNTHTHTDFMSTNINAIVFLMLW